MLIRFCGAIHKPLFNFILGVQTQHVEITVLMDGSTFLYFAKFSRNLEPKEQKTVVQWKDIIGYTASLEEKMH